MRQNSSSTPTADEAALLLHLKLNIWAAAAVVLQTDREAPQPVRDAARELTDLAGRATAPSLTELSAIRHSAAVAALGADLEQAAAAVIAHGHWGAMPDQTLVAQGEMSARGAKMFGSSLIPHLDGLQESLAGPAAMMLDVGTGVGALATHYADQFPSLRVIALDNSERVLELARNRARGSDSSERVIFQLGDIARLNSEAEYDFIWFPAPFIPAAVLEDGIIAATRALKPGGWLLLGHQRTPDGDEAQAIMALQNSIYGGSVLDRVAAVDLLRDAGLQELWPFDFAAPAPAFLAARKPE